MLQLFCSYESKEDSQLEEVYAEHEEQNIPTQKKQSSQVLRSQSYYKNERERALKDRKIISNSQQRNKLGQALIIDQKYEHHEKSMTRKRSE